MTMWDAARAPGWAALWSDGAHPRTIQSAACLALAVSTAGSRTEGA